MTSWPSWLPLRPELQNQSPYGAPQLDVAVRLNTNENPYGPSRELVARIATEVERVAVNLNRYPDRDAVELRTKLADYINKRHMMTLSRQSVWAANGSNEIIQQVLMAFGGPGRIAVGFTPSYSMHELICKTTSTSWEPLPRDRQYNIDVDAAVNALREKRPSVVFVTSPNNPTGTAIEIEAVDHIATGAAAIGALVVVDEAYAEFMRASSSSALSLIDRHPHLVVTRTMSKAFALAGARVGYLIAHPEVVRALQLVRLPYHLSALTQAAAIAALDHADELLASVNQVRQQRDRMVSELESMGFLVVPSDANFVLFGRFVDAHRIWTELLERGVLVRDVGLEGMLRVTAGTPDETDRFLSAIAELKEKK